MRGGIRLLQYPGFQETVFAPAPDVLSWDAVISAPEKAELGGKPGIIASDDATASMPDVVSRNAAISAFEKGTQWEERGWLQETVPQRLTPEVMSLKCGHQCMR